MVGSFLPFLAMNRPQQETMPPVMPLPANNQSLDANLIAQLEAAQYGQTDATQPPAIDLAAMQQMPSAPQAAPRPMMQMPTQEDLNIENQEANAPAMPPTRAERLMQVYEQQQRLQDEAIRSAEEQLSAARNRPQQMDLSPLIALAESWSQQPSGLLRAYRPPTDQAKTVQALQEAVLKARGGAADLAERRETNLGKLEESKEAREQRLQEIALRKRELGQAKEERDSWRKEQKQIEYKEKFDNKYGNNIVGLTEMAQNAKIARDILNRKGRLPVIGDPEFEDYQSAVSSLLVRYNSDKAGLGALAGQDLKLLEKATGTSISSFNNLASNVAGSGAAGAIKVLDRVLKGTDDTVKNIGERAKSVWGDPVADVYQQSRSFYDQARGLGQQEQAKKYSAEELSQIRQQDPQRFQQIKSELGIK
jgi:hypothetical protein